MRIGVGSDYTDCHGIAWCTLDWHRDHCTHIIVRISSLELYSADSHHANFHRENSIVRMDSHRADFAVRIALCGLRWGDCAVGIALWGLHCADCTVGIALCGFRCADFAVRIALCGLRCADCVVRIGLHRGCIVALCQLCNCIEQMYPFSRSHRELR